MGRAGAVLALLLGSVAILWLFAWPRGTGELTALGDGRGPVLTALDTLRSGAEEVSVGTEVVLLRRMENLRHVPRVARLCRGDCDAAMTVIRELSPGGLRKRIVVDLSRFDGADAIDGGAPLPEPVAICIARAAWVEAARAFAGPPDDCVPSHGRFWRLPFGL